MSLTNIRLSQIITCLKKISYHFVIFWFLIFMHMLNWAEPYRVFININLIIVVLHGISHLVKGKEIPYLKLIAIFVVPISFMALHMLAIGKIVFIKEMRLLILATSLTAGIWILANCKMDQVKKYILPSTILLILTYFFVQIIAIIYMHRPFGTTKNPHYLAQYSALCLPVAAYCYSQVLSIRVKSLLIIAMLGLGALVLYTSSRPAWIALLISALIRLFFLNEKKRVWVFSLILIIPIFLFLTNVANFGSRITELAENITKEERVTIWHDAWILQKTSNNKEWLIGHGMDSFLENFKPYSNYHKQSIDYNGPHNFFLELLYTSGIIGVGLFVFVCSLLYGYLIGNVKLCSELKIFNGLLISILTFNLLFVIITIPFFTSYNLNLIALVGGAALFSRKMAMTVQK